MGNMETDETTITQAELIDAKMDSAKYDGRIIATPNDSRAGWLVIQRIGDVARHHRIGGNKGQADWARAECERRWPLADVRIVGEDDIYAEAA